MYLLDTNIVSELRKPRPHGGVVAWLQSTDDAELHLSAVTLGELVIRIAAPSSKAGGLCQRFANDFWMLACNANERLRCT